MLAQTGDIPAFEQLLRSIYGPVRRYVAKLAGESAADDIMQDVSFRIFRQIRNLREPKVFRAWTFRIATRLAFAQMKKAKRWCELENDSELIRSLTTAGSSAYSAGTAKSRLSYGVATIRKSLKEQTR